MICNKLVEQIRGGIFMYKVLCISTGEWVLRMPFAGWNQFFDTKTIFYVLFSHKMYKMKQKITKKHIIKGDYQHVLLTFPSGVNQRLGVNQLLRVTPKA